MKCVKLFEGFHSICKEYGIFNYTINSDGSIDVNGRVDLYNKKLDKLPLKFNKIDGPFFSRTNKLTTLEGGPNYVDGYFSCRHNNLTTLVGAPNHVKRGFFCDNNKMLTFEGAPEHIGGEFTCHDNPIYLIWGLFRDYSKVELLNDYDALRIENGKGVCILSRLNGFLEDTGFKLVDWQIEEIKKHYEIR